MTWQEVLAADNLVGRCVLSAEVGGIGRRACGILKCVRIEGDRLFIEQEWVATSNDGRVWDDCSFRSIRGLLDWIGPPRVRRDGRIDFSLPGEGEYHILPRGANLPVVRSQVRGVKIDPTLN